MADKMMRISARGDDGKAKAIRATNEGILKVEKSGINISSEESFLITIQPGDSHRVEVDLNGYDYFNIFLRLDDNSIGNQYLVTSFGAGLDGSTPTAFIDGINQRHILFSSSERSVYSRRFKVIYPFEKIDIINLSSEPITFSHLVVFRGRL